MVIFEGRWMLGLSGGGRTKWRTALLCSSAFSPTCIFNPSSLPAVNVMSMSVFEGGWTALWGLLCLSLFFRLAKAGAGHLFPTGSFAFVSSCVLAFLVFWCEWEPKRRKWQSWLLSSCSRSTLSSFLCILLDNKKIFEISIRWKCGGIWILTGNNWILGAGCILKSCSFDEFLISNNDDDRYSLHSILLFEQMTWVWRSWCLCWTRRSWRPRWWKSPTTRSSTRTGTASSERASESCFSHLYFFDI